MFRKLMAIETAALRQDEASRDGFAEVSDRELVSLSRDLSRFVAGPSRFGICASRQGY